MFVFKSKKYISDSFYINKVKENIWLIFLSFILAGICTYITYPGIMYTDSYARVESADIIIKCVENIFSDSNKNLDAWSWVTITPSVFMAICKACTGNVAFYTLLQAFLFMLLTFLLVKKLDTSYRKWQYLLVVINPIIWGLSVYYEASIGCVTGIAAIILILNRRSNTRREENNKFDIVFEIILLIISSYVVFGYRANAITILPVLIVYVLKLNYKKIKKIMILSSLIIGIFLVSLVPRILNIDTMSSQSAGLVWEMITVIQRMDKDTRKEYIDYLDNIGGKDSTKRALESSNEMSVNGFLWEKGLNTNALSKKGASNKVMKKYFNLIKEQPKLYAEVKFSFCMKTLGVSQPIQLLEYEYNRDNQMFLYNFKDWDARHKFINGCIISNNLLSFFTGRPFLALIITIIGVIYSYRIKSKNCSIYSLMLWITIFYYGAFIVNTQSFEVRYYYPSLYLMMIMDIAIFCDIINKVLKLVKCKK